MNQSEIVGNMERCNSFKRCSQNFCPLDFELALRFGFDRDRCRYMREPKKAKVKGREFISGGTVMPDEILVSVPESNLEWLNKASRGRREELKDSRTLKHFKATALRV